MPVLVFRSKCLTTLFLLFSCLLVSSQVTSTIDLVSYLETLEEDYDLSFSYNPSIFRGIVISYPSTKTYSRKPSVAELLEELETLVSVRLEESSPGNYLLLPIRSQVDFSITDEETGQSIPLVHYQLNDGRLSYLLPQDTIFSLPEVFITDSVSVLSKFHIKKKVAISNLMKERSISLSPDTVYLDEVAVFAYLTSGVNAQLDDHSLQVDLKNLGLFAGETDGDVLLLLRAVPGIRTPDGKPGSLNIRGSSFDQNLVQFDDIPIYHSGHFFGTVSPYNPLIIDNISIQRNTLPSNWGGRVGGMVDIRSKQEIPDSLLINVSANTIFGGVALSAPINNKLGVHFAGRSTYPFDYSAPKLEAFTNLNFQGSRVDPDRVGGPTMLDRFDIDFQDVNGKIVYEMDDGNTLSMSFMNINNDFAFDFINANQNLREEQMVDMDNWGVSARWDSRITDRTNLDVTAVTSSFRLSESNREVVGTEIRNDDESQNQVEDWRVLINTETNLTGSSQFGFGYNFVLHQAQHVEFSEGALQDRSREGKGEVHSLFASWKKDFSNKWLTNLGFRVDRFSVNSNFYMQPRLSVSYIVSDKLLFKSSTGISHQYLRQELREDFDDFRIRNQFWFLTDEREDVLRSQQVMIGSTYERGGWLLDVELYQKEVDGFLSREDTRNLESAGLDLLLKKRWRKSEAWVSYGYSDVSLDNNLAIFFDQTHTINTTYLLHLFPFDFALNWGFQSGTPVILPDPRELPMGEILRVPYSDRFPWQHQLDFSVTYQFPKQKKGWGGVVGLSLLNIYDQENIINIFQSQTDVSDPYRTAIGFAPNFQVLLTF